MKTVNLKTFVKNSRTVKREKINVIEWIFLNDNKIKTICLLKIITKTLYVAVEDAGGV